MAYSIDGLSCFRCCSCRVLNKYAYADLVHNSLDSDSQLGPGLNYTIHNVSVNFEAEFARLQATSYRSSYAFHQDVQKLMTRFFDAHTIYLTPFSSVTFALPFIFGSTIVNEEQKLTVDRVVHGTFPAYYELLKGPPFINFDKYSDLFPSLAGSQAENLVTTVNGEPAMQWARQMADSGGYYKSAGVRFNSFLGTGIFGECPGILVLLDSTLYSYLYSNLLA